ncbi:MAG: hypothetical protein MI741_13940 [Rhodospirillales bacterium]|nr:hypothetical protein [Rhodospirillales bacterium]
MELLPKLKKAMACAASLVVSGCYIPIPEPQVSSEINPPFLQAAEISQGVIPDETGCVDRVKSEGDGLRTNAAYQKLLVCLTEYHVEPLDCSSELRTFLTRNSFNCLSVEGLCIASVVEIYSEYQRFSSVNTVLVQLSETNCISSIDAVSNLQVLQ